MMKLKTISLIFLMMQYVASGATETILWQGSKNFLGWSDVLNVNGDKFNDAKADDVLHLSIIASEGAQLQLSWGNSWICFDGLECMDIRGNYNILLTANDVSRVKQGIHIKGVNYTLTAVTLKSNDGEYETQANELFAWQDMLLSGAMQGNKCTVSLKPYGGLGWYWPETVDLSSYGGIVVKLLQPAAETMTVQLLYNEDNVKKQQIVKGAAQCKLVLTAAHKNVYSVNIISEKTQTVSIGSINLTDKSGNVVSTSIGSLPSTSPRILSTEYYNAAGVRITHQQRGITIVKENLEGNRTVIKKKWN